MSLQKSCTLGCSKHNSLFDNGMHARCCMLSHAVPFAVARPVQGSINRMQNILHNEVCRMVGVIFSGRSPKDASADQDRSPRASCTGKSRLAHNMCHQ